jgi:hypothetical protein
VEDETDNWNTQKPWRADRQYFISTLFYINQ